MAPRRQRFTWAQIEGMNVHDLRAAVRTRMAVPKVSNLRREALVALLDDSGHIGEPDPEPTWLPGFRKALVDAVIRNGSPLSSSPEFYGGWMNRDWEKINRRVKEVGIDYDRCRWEKSSWNEFMGTFYEGDTRRTGLDMTVVLKDGTTHTYRYDGSVSDLILAVVND